MLLTTVVRCTNVPVYVTTRTLRAAWTPLVVRRCLRAHILSCDILWSTLVGIFWEVASLNATDAIKIWASKRVVFTVHKIRFGRFTIKFFSVLRFFFCIFTIAHCPTFLQFIPRRRYNPFTMLMEVMRNKQTHTYTLININGFFLRFREIITPFVPTYT